MHEDIAEVGVFEAWDAEKEKEIGGDMDARWYDPRMVKSWEGQVVKWGVFGSGVKSVPYIPTEGEWLLISFPPDTTGYIDAVGLTADVHFRDMDGSVVEVRVKEPESHICGQYRMRKEYNKEYHDEYWIFEESHYPSGVMAIGQVVKFCPNCGKKLE